MPNSRNTSLPPDLRRPSLSGMPDLRRTSTQMPVTRQVGFHVEGVAESPAQESTLADQHLHEGAVTAGSPSPVTIPPTFQVASNDIVITLEDRASLDIRTTSLPVGVSTRFLPDPHLARGDFADDMSDPTNVTVSADLTKLEIVAKQNSNPWEAAPAVNTSVRDVTTRGGMRLGSHSSSTPLAAAMDAAKAPETETSLSPHAKSQQKTSASRSQSPKEPNSDPFAGLRSPDGQASPSIPASSSLRGLQSPLTSGYLPFALAAPRLRTAVDSEQASQELMSVQTLGDVSKASRGGGDGRPPLRDTSVRMDKGSVTTDACNSTDRDSLTSAELHHPDETHGTPALDCRNSATLAAIAAAAEAGAAAKGRSSEVAPGGRSPQQANATVSVFADQQQQQPSSAGASPRSAVQSSQQKLQPHLSPQSQQRHHRVSSQGGNAPSRGQTPQSDDHIGDFQENTQVQQPKQKQQQLQDSHQRKGPGGQQQQQQQQQQQTEQQSQPQRKQMSKAERRAVQEDQRAAKAAAKLQQGGGKLKGKRAPNAEEAQSSVRVASLTGSVKEALASSSNVQHHAADSSGKVVGGSQGAHVATPGDKTGAVGGKARGTSAPSAKDHTIPHFTDLFSHLQQYKMTTADSVMAEGDSGAASVHPAVLRLGLRLAEGSVKGASSRCVHMLSALRDVVQDYVTPEGKVLSRDLMSEMNSCIHFLVGCRPLSVGMGNAIKYLKTFVSKLELGMPESAAKAAVCQLIDNYIQEKIIFAGEVLVRQALTKLKDDDVILTFSASSVVLAILLKAKQEKLRFRVVVVDARPGSEGRQLVRQLAQAGVPATYVHINSINYIMTEVTKVVLGAASVNSNGSVMSRLGSAAVAMAAADNGVPVLICCEAFKFVGKVQLDSITSNELGDPAAVAAAMTKGQPSAALTGWTEQANLALLNLKYDAMPSEFVSVIITEFGAIPPSSVPVILREYLLDVVT